MKVIKDIRLYKSEEKNEYGNPIATSFADKKLNAVIHRIVMKLRENGFSLGDFDHLYINFVTFDITFIKSCISHAVGQGKNMLMKFKEKKSTSRKAIIFLQYLDDCMYYPLLRVYDLNDNMLFEKDLPKTLTLDCFGEIQVSTKRIKIKPRKNVFAAKKKEMTFEY